MFLITGLEPFTMYDLEVAGFNQYTSMNTDLYGPEVKVYTDEGVTLLIVYDYCWTRDVFCMCAVSFGHVIVMIWRLIYLDLPFHLEHVKIMITK